MIEIRPVMETQQNLETLEKRITLLLPKNSAFKARARRITLEGSFFGADLNQYLDAEVRDDILKHVVKPCFRFEWPPSIGYPCLTSLRMKKP